MTKCLQCIILVKDCPGKQVKILYEPVAVRHKTAPARQTAGRSEIQTADLIYRHVF